MMVRKLVSALDLGSPSSLQKGGNQIGDADVLLVVGGIMLRSE